MICSSKYVSFASIFKAVISVVIVIDLLFSYWMLNEK